MIKPQAEAFTAKHGYISGYWGSSAQRGMSCFTSGHCIWWHLSKQTQRKGKYMQLAWRVGNMTQQDPGQQGRVEEVDNGTCQVQRLGGSQTKAISMICDHHHPKKQNKKSRATCVTPKCASQPYPFTKWFICQFSIYPKGCFNELCLNKIAKANGSNSL